MPSIDWNLRRWDQRHSWQRDGDEWSGMAEACGQPYAKWKQGLIDTFILPYTGADRDVLELAPGHGRWSEPLVGNSRHVTLVDLSPSCIEACRTRFADQTNVTYVVDDGSSLADVSSASVDYACSFDSMVHMEPDVIDLYVREFARVLRPGGDLTIHHANRRNWTRPLAPAAARLGGPGRVAIRLASQGRLRDSGQRANNSAQSVARIMTSHGLEVVRQTSSWGGSDQYTVDKYRDTITIARRPST